ncbi:MAG TPA: hypothetical protein PKL84_02360, partial [Candidatus Hydrogenedentes bacterium]|nr:hypothetical protein [Candidatus Hydrogenedentota bacterium]
ASAIARAGSRAQQAQGGPEPPSGEINALREELAARDARIVALGHEVAELRANEAAACAECEALRRALEHAREQLAAHSPERFEELEHLLAEERDHAGVLEAQLNQAREECERLRMQSDAPDPIVTDRAAPTGASHIPAFDAKGHKRRMGEILVDLGVLTHDQLMEILDEQIADPQRRFGALVVERGHTDEELVARILAAQSRLPFVRLSEIDIDTKVLGKITPQLARTRRCVPIAIEDDRLRVAMANPLDLIAVEDIEITTKLRVEPVVAMLGEIEAALDSYYGGR